MRKLLTIVLIWSFCFLLNAQETFTISNSGSTFSPALLDVVEGDQITFNVGSFHPVLEVSESTYNANGKTALAGGFSFPDGTGTFTASEPGTIYFVCANHVASGMKGKIIVSAATSIQKQNVSNGFEIFPNPANDLINIRNFQGSDPITVTLSDISGKTLIYMGEQYSSEDKSTLNISELRKGIYFLSLKYSDKTLTRKLVKK